MLNYTTLKDHERDFLAATGLKVDEFEELLPAFAAAYDKRYPKHLTADGQPRRRQYGGGRTGTLASIEDKLLFILIYQKTNRLALPAVRRADS